MTLNISATQHSHDPQPDPDVKDIQTLLVRRGYSVGAAGIDGVFGGGTGNAVEQFQRRRGLVPDRVVGPATFKALTEVAAPGSASADKVADIAYRLVTGPNRPRYRFGAEADLTDPHPKALDCSELGEWAIYQAIHKDWRDGSANQAAACHIISVAQARRTKGALLFVSSNGHINGVHHVAISMGDGTTAEARNSTAGCGSWPVGSRFTFGGLCPVLQYT